MDLYLFIRTLIRNFALFVCCTYIYAKLSRNKMRPCDALALPIAAVYGSLVYFLVEYAEILVPLSQLMALFAYALARYRGDTYPTLLLSTITCGLVTVISVLAIIASILPVAMPIYLFTEEGIVQDCIMLGAIGAIEIILSLLLFRIKRFRAGITPEKDGNVELMVLAAAACIFLNTLFSMGSPEQSPVELIMIFIVFCGLALIIWWRKHITDRYRLGVYRRNVEVVQRQIDEYSDKNSALAKQNDELAKIIHRDNKMLAAMALAVKYALEKYGGEQNRQLLEQIDALLAERNALTEEYAAAENEPYKTGNAALDTVLRYIANRAANSGAAFEVKCGEGAFGTPAKDEKFLSDCCSVLCDLGENAACAVKKGGKISAELGTSYGAPYIAVCDDAPPFDLNVLKLMGKRRVTTRKAEGGTGIGLMAVAAIADKHRASFVFEEHTKDRYFKRLRITFDGADKKRVITDREESAAIFSAREGFTVELLK